ncbi:MAG: hypothetical protein WCP57_12495 [Bacteroidota bacterium]
MKKYIYFSLLSFLVLLNACAFSKYYYNEGDYETAIGVAVSKLKNNSKNWREALVLEKAYNEAFSKDMARIDFLKKEGNPDCWIEIYELYGAINKRQNLVKPLLPIFIKKEYRNADIKTINVDDELIESKRKAAEYLYNHALKLMSYNNKLDYRKAYQELDEIKHYYNSYKDVAVLMQNCLDKGQNYVGIQFKNSWNNTFPKEFEKNILDIMPADFNSQWVKYSLIKDSTKIKYDYSVLLDVQNVNISPEQLRETEFPEEKTIEDGWYYAVDSRGNVKKDSLGNDIKLKKYITVRCIVKETIQNKQGSVQGNIIYFKSSDNPSNFQTIKNIPYNENLIFTNIYAVAQGDQRALSDINRKKIGGRPLPFPTNIQMVMDATNLLKARLIESLRSNQNLVMN